MRRPNNLDVVQTITALAPDHPEVTVGVSRPTAGGWEKRLFPMPSRG